MRKETRIALNGYMAQVAKVNGIESAAEKFTVEPTAQQRLETAIQESSGFLKRINIVGVTEKTGESLSLGVTGSIAGRTDTTQKDRQPRTVHGLTKDSYDCKKTDFDTALAYATIDAWAKFQDFQARLAGAVAERQALDRIMIGFNGTSAADETNRSTNPLLQDVNIGWLQKIRTSAADRVMTEVVEDSGKVTLGATGDYKTLDGIVFDAIQALEPWHRKHPNLVVLVDRNLLHSKLLNAVERGADSNQEENAVDEIIAKARLGGLPIVDAPFFPDGTLLVTTLDNLSIYWQEGARRRHLIDNPKRDRFEDYQSSNDAYVIEDFGLVSLVENIEAV